MDKFTLETLLDIDFRILDKGKLLQVSERTIYRQMAQFGLQKRESSDIDDDNLDIIVSNIIKDFPRCGEQMLREILMAKEMKNTKMETKRLDTSNRSYWYQGEEKLVTP